MMYDVATTRVVFASATSYIIHFYVSFGRHRHIIMNWLVSLLRSKLLLTVALNCVALAGFMALRFAVPAAAQRPNLSLSHTTDVSVAHWLGDRLADVAALVGTLLHQLVQ
jgi:hypothetical protein